MWSLPIGLGETSERALPAWAVSLPLECTLLDIKVLHGPVRAAHQDLPAEKGRMGKEQSFRGIPYLRPGQGPLTWVSLPVPQHRAFTASSRLGFPDGVKFAACFR